MRALIDQLYEKNMLSKEELAYIIDNISEEDSLYLYNKADIKRRDYYGVDVYMRGLIEFSNYCSKNCLYCGIRRDNKNVDRYRLSVNEIIECCDIGYKLGYRTFVLQSGEDPYYTVERMVAIIKRIKSQYDAAITLSVGERPLFEYKAMFEAGADRYLLRHETASRKLYEQLHPDMRFEDRVACLNQLKEIGYQVGAGFMVGLPNQTAYDLAEDLLFLKQLSPDMIGIGPFIPHNATPLSGSEGGTVDKTLIMLSLTRLMIPDVLLPSTTAMGTLNPKGREKAIQAGANVVMPNLSPTNVREKYELYENKICTGDEAAHCRGCIERRINSAGFNVNMSRGDSYRFEKYKV